MRKLWLYAAAALTALILLSGGTDSVDINRMVFIVGIGADRIEEEYRFTFYSAVPTGSDTAVSENNVSYESVSITSDSLADAIRQFERDSSKKISLEHLSCCTLGVSMEHENIPSVLDPLLRDPSVRRQSILALLDLPAEEFYSAEYSGSIASGAAALLEQQSDSERTGEVMTLGRFRGITRSETGFCLHILGIAAPDGEDSGNDASVPRQIRTRGLAVFSKGRLTGKLTPEQTELARLFGGRQSSGIITTVNENGHSFHYRITYSRCRKMFIPGETATGFFDIAVECILVAAENPDSPAPNEKQVSSALHRQLSEILDVSRIYGSAVTGLETEARQSAARWYSEHYDSWYDIYRKANLELTVKCEIEQRSG